MSESAAMTITEYIYSRGLTVTIVAQQMGVRKQAVQGYGKKYNPTVKTLNNVAMAMTALGAPTTVADICGALYPETGSK